MEIKPCPFCGSKAFIERHEPHVHKFAIFMPDHPGSVTIECVNCSCGMIAESEIDVIKQWNNRYEIESLRAKLAEAEKDAERIANVAHHGALIGFSGIYEAMSEIRRFSVKYWNREECMSLQAGIPIAKQKEESK